jgi:hypothetical protein
MSAWASHSDDAVGGVSQIQTHDVALPIQGSVTVPMPIGRLWEVLADVARWPDWNPCMYWARVTGGELRAGAHLVWVFNPIRPVLLYRLPALARIVECEPRRVVTWEVSVPPGFHALHSYRFEGIDEDTSRFGSWEVAEGPVYRALRPFWLAHFRFVRDASLEGAQRLAERP